MNQLLRFKYCFLTSVLWGGGVGGQLVRDLLVKSLQVRRGQGVTMWTVPPRTITRQEEMPRSGAG